MAVARMGMICSSGKNGVLPTIVWVKIVADRSQVPLLASKRIKWNEKEY